MVGALVLGGAATGTTVARWQDAATVSGGTLGSATVAVTVDGAAVATLGSLPSLPANDGATPGATRTVTAMLLNDSTRGAKNMSMQLHLDDVTASDPTLAEVLEVAAATVAPGEPCPSPAGPFTRVRDHRSTSLGPETLRPGDARQLCLDVRVRGGADPASLGGTGVLTLTVRGQQVRS